MTIPAAFSEAFASYRRMLAGARDDEVRTRIIADCAYQAGKSWLPCGLARPDAVDELYDMALAAGLLDCGFIGAALTRGVEAADQAPGMPAHTQPGPGEARGKSNGQQRDAPPRVLPQAKFMEGFVPPDYVVEGILQFRFIYALTGQTSHAKTAVALLLAQLVACDEPNAMLGRHKVEHGRVVYFVGENPDDVRMRLMGSHHCRRGAGEHPENDRIWFVPGVCDLERMIPVLAADAAINGNISLIIVDTSAAYFTGDEELSNTQMGAYARKLRTLTTVPGAPCVLVLCHPIKHAADPSQLLPRGGGAYLNEIDGNLTLWRQDEIAILDTCGKFRGAGFQPIAFRLERLEHIPKLVDKKGRFIPTVHAVAITPDEEDIATNKNRCRDDLVLAIMLKEPESSLLKWATALGWENAKGEADKKTVENAVNRLSRGKPALIRKNRDRWELTDEGKVAARKAALQVEARKLAETQGKFF